ncbi:tyrosine-protein phosphatase [Saccharopolyspora montiporae]|uniref:tyrosine-protein phosphatase n=1 Tax=Saccharopolyspora montiporae TaxID=2781240 RepID=UPI00351C8A4F
MSTTDPADVLGGLVNFRDLGGLPMRGGTFTAPGVLYRSDAPHVGDRAPQDAPEWPPAAVVDLRDEVELDGAPHPMADVAEVHQVPLLEDVRPGDSDRPDDHELTVLYQGIVDHAAKKLVEVFRIVLNAGGPVLIHCAAGKDRTGVSAALLLSLVEVRRDAVVADYVRTDGNMFRVLQRLQVLSPELPPGVDVDSVRELMSTPAEAIERVLGRFAAHPGGAADWLRGHGVTDEELQRWRERFAS